MPASVRLSPSGGSSVGAKTGSGEVVSGERLGAGCCGRMWSRLSGRLISQGYMRRHIGGGRDKVARR